MTWRLALSAALVLVACGSNNNGSPNTTNNKTSNTNNTNTTGGTNTDNNGGTNSETNTSGETITPDAPTFADAVAPVLIANCAIGFCHLAPGNNTSFLIADPPDVAAVRTALDGVATAGGTDLVLPGNIDGSELWLRITGTRRLRMPLNGAPIPQEDIDAIAAWITAGAAYE